jgi:hypothetical protein
MIQVESTNIFKSHNRRQIRAKIRYDAGNRNCIQVKFASCWKRYWTGKFDIGKKSELTTVLTYGHKPLGLVIAGGKGYFVDIEKQMIRKVSNDEKVILSAVSTTDQKFCVASTMSSVYVIDTKGNIQEILPDFSVDGIYLQEDSLDEIIGKLESDINQYDREIPFRVNPNSLQLYIDY